MNLPFRFSGISFTGLTGSFIFAGNTEIAATVMERNVIIIVTLNFINPSHHPKISLI